MKLYDVLNALSLINVLTANYFLKKFSLVWTLHHLQDSLIHWLNQGGCVRRKKQTGHRTIAAAEPAKIFNSSRHFFGTCSSREAHSSRSC